MTEQRYIPNGDFRPGDLYQAICEKMIDEGILEIERDDTGYRWKLKDNDERIMIQVQKNKSKIEFTL